MKIVMPQLGETVDKGTVSVWHKKAGDDVEANELLFEVETDKVEVEVPAPVSGVLTEIIVPEGETVEVGTTLAVIAEPGSEGKGDASVAPAVEPPAATAGSSPATRVAERGGGDEQLSPVVRRLIAEHGLDPAEIPRTGANGRLKRNDVLAFIEARGAGGSTPKATSDRTVIPLSKIRKRTGRHMVMSKATSPHVLQAVEVDFHNVERARDAHGAGWRAREGFGLSYLPFIAHAVCQAVAEFPHINASIEGENLVLHGPVNLGVAVDLEFEGLIAPVLKDAQRKSVSELALAIRDLSVRARKGALTPDDLTEGTYTLSNSGPFGTLITAPIINQPQVAILSSDGVRKKPVVVETADGDSIAIRPVGVLAQSFDHRAFDGAYSAAYLNRLRQIIEATDWSAELSSTQ